jgi:hypothetical protein
MKAPKAKDCHLFHPSKDFWEYHVECPCCGSLDKYFIVKYPSGRYWLINGHEDKVAWGSTLAITQRKARERVLSGKERKDAYMAKLRKEHPEYFEPKTKRYTRKKKAKKKRPRGSQ